MVSSANGSIWQSSDFAEFQTSTPGRSKSWILAAYENDKLIGGIQIYRFDLGKGYCWLYGGRGPIIGDDYGVMHVMLQEIKLLAEKEKAIFFRLDPPNVKIAKWGKQIDEGFQPQSTLVLDLNLSEEELLKQMKSKGRYNIKLARKKGVEIIEGGIEDLKSYEKLLKETTIRDGFSGHKIDFYKNMLKQLGEKKMCKLFLAKYEGEVLAAAICTYFGKIATYYYGVSSNKNRNIMAPYLLQWEMIKDAKEGGYDFYDFLGISPSNSKGHKWDGVTSFKKKFGGEVIDYPKPQEIAYKKPLYWLFCLKRMLNKFR